MRIFLNFAKKHLLDTQVKNENVSKLYENVQANIYGLKYPINKRTVEVIRKRFLLEADTNPHLYDPIDVQRCRTEDWQTERFLLEKKTPEEALKALVKTMRWKKSFGVHKRDRKYFPKELVTIFGSERYSLTKQGHICYWLSPGKLRNITGFNLLFRQYCVYYFDKMDRHAGNRGYISIGDFRDVSLINADFQLAMLGTELLQYYPQVVLKGFLLNLPTPMMTAWNIARSFMSKTTQNTTIMIKREDLLKYVDLDINEIPVSFGGNRETDNDMIADMLPLSQCKHLAFTDKQIEIFYKTFKL